MPYLSRVLINPARSDARRLFVDPQLAKGAILGEFAQQPVAERVLWRLGRRVVAGRPVQGELLILTQSKPSWNGLVERFGYPGQEAGEPQVRSYEPLLGLVAVGREFAFCVNVNPVQNTVNPRHPTASQTERLARDNHLRSIRMAHRTAAAQTAWFVDRATTWGFEIAETTVGEPDVRIVDRRSVEFTKGGAERHRVHLGTATFEGRLRVIDTARFTHSLLAGIGPAKGYGCGLLTLARLHDVPA